MSAGIYKITSPIGKIYIGRSVNIKKRWDEHKNKTNSIIYKSISKYGYENHLFEVLCNCVLDHDLLNKLEIFYIKLYNSTDLSIGMNLCRGGGRLGFNHTNETINKMKENRKGWRNSLGRVLSLETKEKISKSLTGSKAKNSTLIKAEKTRLNNDIVLPILDTHTGIFYMSKRDVCKFNKISRNTLSKYIGTENYRFTY